ncbi:putative porin [Methylomonas albis]|uniref:Porin n=1 Tax=Methylomonas albis TaxID=1854563 RepID=A0ABR9CXY0_9GAMM|nr:putative porin [Methylomonas albis]MBD9355742.1 putative porin [Methylomonas albis]
MANKKQLIALALSGLIGTVQAGEKEELLKLRNTTTNLIKQLVKQGVITDKAANEMIKQAEVEAGQQVAEAKAAGVKEAVPADEVRVAYVPDFVKDEIRQQVRTELREEVVGDVMQKAKSEQWGMPNALPEWTRKFKLSGDLRLREQSEYYPADNTQFVYENFQAINDRGGTTAAAANSEQFVDVNKDRHRLRERLRLGIDANVAEGLDAGVRLATGNIRNPTSTNQTLGNYGDRYEFRLDRAFLKYDLKDDSKFNWLTLAGGRIANPFFTGGSELVWDEDLSFEGAAATVRHRFGGSGSLGDIGNSGPTMFATVGAFPLQETALSTKDKWLFGGQAGVDWGFANQDNLKIGVGYFDYRNTQARPNTNVAGNYACNLNNADNNFSRPDYMQLGNTLTTVCRDTADTTLKGLVGLASDYNIVNINALYDMAIFSPVHLKLSADFAKNIGFSLRDIKSRYGNPGYLSWFSNGYGDPNKAQTTAWQVRADLGWTKVDVPGNWSVFTMYKHLERDAVLDAYTDSDFHLGGTNVKGWVIGGNYGLMKNVWLTGRWLSGDVINGPRYGVDMLQIDVNTRF